MSFDLLKDAYRTYNEAKIQERYAWLKNIYLAFYSNSKMYRHLFTAIARKHKKKYMIYNNIANQLWYLIKQSERELGNNEL